MRFNPFKIFVMTCKMCSLYWPTRLPYILIKFLPSLVLHCKKFAMCFFIRLKP